MDPLTALALAGNIVTFIDFSYQLISGTYQVLNSASGTTTENATLNVVVDDLNTVTKRLAVPGPGQTENEMELCSLAAACHALSVELSTILNQLKLTDKNSKWGSLQVKWRSMRKQQDITSMEQRLNSFRTQIIFRLQMMLSEKNDSHHSSVQAKLDTIQNEAKGLHSKTADELSALRYEIKTSTQALQDNTENWSLAKKLGDSLARIQNLATSAPNENYILQRLTFKSMYNREGNIEDAESGTFSWMVENDPGKKGSLQEYPEEKEENAMRKETRQKFLTWLKEGCHIFHISGKAGAGKSTLMKFLGKSRRVERALRSWAGDQNLVFAQFYFWSSGDKLQRSLEGLYRSLLFETCTQCPDLIPKSFPELWNSLTSGSAPPQQTPLRREEIKVAFNNLISAMTSSSHRVCFFVDGLDEFEGEARDNWDLARSLQSWTESENVKLCVSSRPHVEFLHSFKTDVNIQIHLHYLTRGDIRNFSLTMFETDRNFDLIKNSYKDWVDEIVMLAEGVFLWARLVIRLLLKDMGYRSTGEDLRRRLHTIPKDVDKLYDHLFNELDPSDQRLSDKLFLIATPHRPPGRNFFGLRPVSNALAYLWLQDLDDSNFPSNRPVRVYSDAEMEELIQNATCNLDRLSRGLLEIKQNHVVRFFHRTAHDYVESRLPQMQSRMPRFDVNAERVRLLLAELKCVRATATARDLNFHFENTFTWISNIHREHKIPSKYLEEFGEVFETPVEDADALPEDLRFISQGFPWGEKRFPTDLICSYTVSDHPISYLFWLLSHGLEQCLEPAALNRLKLQNPGVGGPNLLLSACIYGRVDFVRSLLREGWSPKEMVDIFPNDRPSKPEKTRRRTTVWMVLLCWLGQTMLQPRRYREEPDEPSQILEEFLQFDVDCDVQFTIGIPALVMQNASEMVYTISLLRAVELRNPPNAAALKTKLQKKPWWRQLASTFIPGDQTHTTPSPTLEAVTGTRLHSVTTGSDRLDSSFSFIIR